MIEIFVMMMIIVSMIIETVILILLVIMILLITAQYHDYHDHTGLLQDLASEKAQASETAKE